MGLSEVELFKNGGQFDETTLKIPGYTLLFPKSWTVHSFARVVVYVKNNLEYVQVPELEDNLIQSIWIKGGFKRGKKVYYCHGYREHTSKEGKSLASQAQNLMKFLAQWEDATCHGVVTQLNQMMSMCVGI